MGAAARRTLSLGRKSAFKYLNRSQAAIIQLVQLAVLRADWMRLERQFQAGAFQAWRSHQNQTSKVVEQTGSERLMEAELGTLSSTITKPCNLVDVLSK